MGCPNCQDNASCNEVTCTGDVTCVTANFINLNVPAGAGLNYVLEQLEALTINAVNDIQNIGYVLNEGADCIGLEAGTYSFAQLIQAIVDTLCTIQSTPVLNTDTLLIGNEFSIAPCLTDFEGSTTSDILSYLTTKLCDIINNTVTQGNTGVIIGSHVPNQFAPTFILKDVLAGIVQNKSYISEQTNPTTSGTSLSITINPLKGVVNYYPVIKNESVSFTMTPNKDVYFVMDSEGVIAKHELSNGAPYPSYPNDVILYKVVTNGTGVASLTNQFETTAINPTPLSIPDGYVKDNMIATAAVTEDKLYDSTVTAGSYGYESLISIRVNGKGIVTDLISNMLFTGLANGQILKYNAANSRWENADQISTGTNGKIPVSNGSNYTDSVVSQSSTQVSSTRKIEVNKTGGAMQDDANAVINGQGGPYKIGGLSATAASALPLTDGYFTYVNTTNVTFTSVGFWGVVAGAWVKLS